MANTFVQGNRTTTTAAGATQSIAFPGSVTAGDLLALTWRDSVEFGLNALGDNMGVGNVWTVVYNQLIQTNSIRGGWAYVFTKGSGPCTVTQTFGGSIASSVMTCGQWHGPNAVRAVSAAATGAGTVLTSPSVTSVAGDLLIGAFTVPNASATVTAGGGFTKREEGQAAAITYTMLEDLLSSGGGSVSASSTWSTSATDSTSGIGAFFFNPALAGTAGWVNRHRSFANKR